jgi:hypothetical protein
VPAGAGLYKNWNQLVKHLQAEKTGTILLLKACIKATLKPNVLKIEASVCMLPFKYIKTGHW